MRLRIAVLVIVFLGFATMASGFNGERKGFVLGGGIGFAPVIKTSVLSSKDESSGLGVNLLIGYAWDDKNMIVYEGNASGFTIENTDLTVTQGYYGANWYHYFGPAGRSAFTAIGIGIYQYKIEKFDANDPGFAVIFGGGFEFARHWQVGGYLSFGKTSFGPWEFDHTNFNILISTVAF